MQLTSCKGIISPTVKSMKVSKRWGVIFKHRRREKEKAERNCPLKDLGGQRRPII